jgi:hypothetical protein
MKHQRLFHAGVALLGFVLGTERMALAQESAVYVVTFKGTWTEKSHPLEYPESGVFTGPHFSGLIGAAHGNGYSMFMEGKMPTAGLEKLSEEGKHSPLDQEIKDAMKAGKAGSLFETGPIKDFSKVEVTEVKVTDQYPMVSAVAMIAPSPDWFAGASNISLKEGGKWVQEKTVEMYAWDSGGDDGATYEASDVDVNPKKPTMKATTAHFVSNGKTAPVGLLTFTLMK